MTNGTVLSYKVIESVETETCAVVIFISMKKITLGIWVDYRRLNALKIQESHIYPPITG